MSRRNWNEDPFTKKARRENVLARSLYKLEAIDKKRGLFKGVRRVIDLGASPGSWTQYCLKKPQVTVFAVDLKPLELEDPRVHFHQGDAEEMDWATFLGGEPVDLVLSDMAPNTSGNATRDTALSAALAEMARDVAVEHLNPGGSFVAKFFMGPDFEEYRNSLREHFSKVTVARPDSTRKQSREVFFVGQGFGKSA